MAAQRAKIVKVFIGRFQPFHLGHQRVLSAACATSDLVIVIIGATFFECNPHLQDNVISKLKNPWSVAARTSMILNSLTPAERKVVEIRSQSDLPGADHKWVKSVKDKVRAIASFTFPGAPISYTLIGCHKGADTYYLKLYKGWRLELVPQSEALNATDVRTAYFNEHYDIWKPLVPPPVAAFMDAYRMYQTDEFKRLAQEQENQRHEQALSNIERSNG